MRMQYNLGSGVHSFPSIGGMLQKDCSTVELQYLGLPTALPVDIDKFTDADEEDAFCQKMRMLGATHWASMGAWVESLIGDRKRVGEENVGVRVGWPRDGRGVWVVSWLWTDKVEVNERLNRLKTAEDMDERCRMIEDMGGRFYERADECPELARAFGEVESSEVR
ncbi:hypothetical protein BKA65DRAFT_552120 [Rhexocercosporidium sp. MPI-PUGE-AT-0058]|nr:hypothetical protein BKA65DRAFT_552120 [Rhexocercosporidium sp. MPI-PUGE-AT-0058]